MSRSPQLILLGGPNGAGKSTAARGILRDLLKLGEFVNADTIATGLAGFAPQRAAFAAGRLMLARLRQLAAARADFAFETTMASRTFAPWLRELRSSGYEINMVFMWIRSPELARACYALALKSPASMRHANTSQCRPASVVGKRS